MTQQLERAIERARQTKMSVKLIGGRVYLVTTPENHRYTVRFEMVDGLRYGRCNCKAGARQMACRHLPKAALYDTGLQQMRVR